MHITVENPSRKDVVNLLEEHLHDMHAHSPACSVHALDLDGLRSDDVTFWTARINDELMGCGALKQIDQNLAEIKSMRTAEGHKNKGVAAAILQTIIDQARANGCQKLNLETGSTEPFQAAIALYTKFGFEECGPFAGYIDDPFSLFMTKGL